MPPTRKCCTKGFCNLFRQTFGDKAPLNTALAAPSNSTTSGTGSFTRKYLEYLVPISTANPGI